jgi:hypothetical protein
MADQPTTPPERLKDLVAVYLKSTSKDQIAAFRKTLTPQELKDLDAYLGTYRIPEEISPPETIEAPAKEPVIYKIEDWTPAKQLELEKTLTTKQIEEARKALTQKQQTQLTKHLETLPTQPKAPTREQAGQAASKALKDLKEKTAPKPPTADQIKESFDEWATGYESLSIEDLLDVYTKSAGLTTEQANTLKASVRKVPGAGAGAPTPKPIPTPTPTKPTVKPELIIKRIPYPKWWRDSLTATINLTAPGSQTIATVAGKLRLYVATIVITVTGGTVITIGFGTAGTSGPIFLGGEGQPMGMVIAMGNSPAPCGAGPLTIAATGNILDPKAVGGFATCFVEQETT